MSQFILATGGYESTVRLFDAQNATLLRTIQFADSQVLQLAFSGVGPVATNEPLFLAVAGSPRVAIYDVSANSNSTSPTFLFEGHTGPVTAVGFEPKAPPRFVYSASEDGTLQVWSPESPSPLPGERAAPVQGAQPPVRSDPSSVIETFVNGEPINAATFHAATQLFFTADRVGCIGMWSLEKRKRVATATPHPSRRHMQTVELSSDGTRLVCANADGKVFIYEVTDLVASPDMPPLSSFQPLEEKTYITRTRMSMDCKRLACTFSTGLVTVYNMEDTICRHVEETGDNYGRADSPVQPWRSFRGHVGWAWDAVFIGEQSNYLFTCSTNTHVILWNLEEDHSSTEYAGHAKAVVCLAVKELYEAGPQGGPAVV